MRKLSDSLAHLLNNIVRTGDLIGLCRVNHIRAEFLRTRDSLHELGLTSWSKCNIAHASIAIVCLTSNQSDLLHREEESSNPTRCESDRICEIHSSHALILGSGECIQYQKIRPPESTETGIEPAWEYGLNTTQWDKKWKSRGDVFSRFAEKHKIMLKIYLINQVYWNGRGSQKD